MIDINLINELRVQIETQAAQIQQLKQANLAIAKLIDQLSYPPADTSATSMIVDITNEFIEFEVIRKIENLVAAGIKKEKPVVELKFLINKALTGEDLVKAFNHIIDKYVYQHLKDCSDHDYKNTIALLVEIGYEMLPCWPNCPTIGPYWERVIGDGVRITKLYRPPFQLKYKNDDGSIETV